MISLDAVRTALAEADPHAAMDRLARVELAAGRTTADIYAELGPLAGAIRQVGGLTQDARYALAGALDALTGDCDPEQCYQDPTNAVAASRSGKRSKRSRLVTHPDPDTVSAIEKRLALALKRLRAVNPRPLPTESGGKTSSPPSQAGDVAGVKPVEPSEKAKYRIILPTGTKKLKGLGVSRRANGIYLVSHGDLATLAGANIPFAVVGAADD